MPAPEGPFADWIQIEHPQTSHRYNVTMDTYTTYYADLGFLISGWADGTAYDGPRPTKGGLLVTAEILEPMVGRDLTPEEIDALTLKSEVTHDSSEPA